MTQFTVVRSAGVRLRLLALVPLLALAAPLLSSAEAASPPQGIDVSKYQHDTGKPIDWNAVKRSGQSFAFIKASGGSDRTDPWFEREWAAAGKAGMIRGAYHYADPSKSADAQAAHVVSVVGSTREANNLGIALDLESTGGLSPSKLATWAHTFLDGVEKRTGRVPVLYTGPNFWHTRMKDNKTFGAYPLWIAHYTTKTPATLPGWDRWTFWQHTSSHRIPGIPGLVDHNKFCCAAGTLAALADGRSVAITRLWRSLGGASGQLGLPLGTEVATPGGWAQTFEKGLVSSSSAGTIAVLGATYARYVESGGMSGPLGLPTARETSPATGVWQQTFAGGRIVRSEATGAHTLAGPVLARWLADGGVAAPAGLPIAEQLGPAQQFKAAGLYVTPGGVRLVPQGIRDHYEERGGPGSSLGLPTADAEPFLDGQYVTFDNGRLTELVLGGERFIF